MELTLDTPPEMVAIEVKPETHKPRAKPRVKPASQVVKTQKPNWLIPVWHGLWIAVCYAVSFQWVVDGTQWLLATGAKIAESAFLLATTYVIINLVAHKLILWVVFQNTNIIDTLNQIAMIAFSVLPELLAIATLIRGFEQVKYLLLTRRWEFLFWAILFTVPAVIFAVMTITTINGFTSLESLGQNFNLTPDALHWRVSSGWAYGCISMLYAKIGKGNIAKALDDLHRNVSEREGKIKELTGELKELNAVIESQNRVIQETKHQNSTLEKTINKSSETALSAYSEACIEWLKSDEKSVYLSEITQFTGHKKSKIQRAIENGKLAVTTRNKQKVLKYSLIEWLKDNPPISDEKEDENRPALHLVNQ